MFFFLKLDTQLQEKKQEQKKLSCHMCFNLKRFLRRNRTFTSFDGIANFSFEQTRHETHHAEYSEAREKTGHAVD